MNVHWRLRSALSILIFFLSLKKTAAQVDLNNGLVAWLTFNSSMADASGNGNIGIPNGTMYTTDRFGNPDGAVMLNGAGDYIAVKDPLQRFSTTPFSIVLWFQTNSFSSQVFIGKREFGPTNGQQYQLGLRTVEGFASTVVSSALPCPGDLRPDVMDQIFYPEPFCRDTWHALIVTFDGAFHRMYLDGRKVAESAAKFPEMMKCTSDLRLGNWWSGDPQSFNGKLDDFRWYNRILTNDEIQVLSQDKGSPAGVDFSFQRQVCEPSIRLENISVVQNQPLWRFGDGTSATGSNITNKSYSAYERYNVTLIVNSGSLCADSISKPVDLSMAQANIILTPDTALCTGDSAFLRTVSLESFCWTPEIVRRNPAEASGSVSPSTATTYRLQGFRSATSLVVNGDFSAGNSGFTSGYTLTPVQTGDREFGIQSIAPNWYGPAQCVSCTDHTGDAAGRFLIADAATDPDISVWCQNISVQSGNNYEISFWATSYAVQGSPRLALFINGLKAGEVTIGSNEMGVWKKLSVFWTATTTGSVDLCIRNLSLAATGNVFGIDDIAVDISAFVFDTVRVSSAADALVVSPDTSVCRNGIVQLNASGGNGYRWSPATGLSDPNIANPIATPSSTTTYFVSTTGNCSKTDSVLVAVLPGPEISTGGDATICEGGAVQLTAKGGVQYRWTPAIGLSDPLSASPVASPRVNTDYLVVGEDGNGCIDSAYSRVTIGEGKETYIPNAFTPNGDGKNDCFRIPGAGGAAVFELAIFNRFGERVFFSTDPLKCWDGSFRNQQLPTGAYQYYLKIENGCGYEFKKGSIALIK